MPQRLRDLIMMKFLFQEREAEKLGDDGVCDVKPKVSSVKSLPTWHENTFYRHLNILKGQLNRQVKHFCRDLIQAVLYMRMSCQTP